MRPKLHEVDGRAALRVLKQTHEVTRTRTGTPQFDGRYYRPRRRWNRWKLLFAARHPFIAAVLRIQ